MKEVNKELILLEDLGMRYPTENSKTKIRYGLYKCFCGKEFAAITRNIKRGQKSCGCIIYETRHRTHNLTTHRLYNIWKHMMYRCYKIEVKDYVNYGARGITVCDEWHDITKFIEDMYSTFEEGLTLNRKDNDLGYTKDNCEWSSKETQARNTRNLIKTNTSGYRGVSFNKKADNWTAMIRIGNNKKQYLGSFDTPLEAAKAYETFVRLNNLEHNFTPVLTEEEILNLN